MKTAEELIDMIISSGVKITSLEQEYDHSEDSGASYTGDCSKTIEFNNYSIDYLINVEYAQVEDYEVHEYELSAIVLGIYLDGEEQELNFISTSELETFLEENTKLELTF